jgi:nucleotide-binding universal stress UspA family protein
VSARYVLSERDAKAAIPRAAQEEQADLILMGGYGESVLRELVLGSTLDAVLREVRVPVFVCR